MKKKAVKKNTPETKGFFRTAGEVIGSIGHGLAEGKDKVVEMSQTVIEGISHTLASDKKKAAVKKIKKAVKKAAAKKITPKKRAKKTAAKKTVKKVIKKTRRP